MQNTACFSRRRILGGAAMLGAGVPALAACAGEGGDAKTAAPNSGTVLARTGDIDVGGGLILDEAKIVITQPTEGEFMAFSALCTHQACLVTKVSTTINCACHGSKFALADGSVENGPADTALPEIAIKISGDEITAV